MSPTIWIFYVVISIVMLLTGAVQTPHEVELLLSDLIHANNMSHILYVTHRTRTEYVSLRSRDPHFLMIHDVDCKCPELIANSLQNFLTTGGDVRMNIIIDCDTNNPIKNILAKSLPLGYYSMVSIRLLLPIFNVVIVTDNLPGDNDMEYIQFTKELSTELVYIIGPKVKHVLETLHPLPVCDAYSLYKYHSVQDGNTSREQFDITATLTTDCVIEGRTDVMWHTFSGFNGKLLRIGCITNPIFLLKEETGNGTVSYRGLFKDFVDTLAEALDFTYEIVEPTDGNYGVPDTNGVWNGLVGMLNRREVDMLVAGLTVTAARHEVVDFTVSFWDETTIAIYRADKPDIGWMHLFRPFKYQVWLSLLAGSVGAVLFMWTLQLADFSKPSACRRQCLSWRESVWNVYGGSLYQSATFTPETKPSNSVFIGFLLTVVLVVAYYNANLKATMVAPDGSPRYSSLADLAADDKATIVIGGGDSNRNTLETSKAVVLQDIWKRITSKSEVSLQPTFMEAVTMMTTHPNHAAIGDKSHVISFLVNHYSNECNWITIPEALYTSPYALALPQHSPYKQVIDNVITQLVEMGIIRKWFQKAIPSEMCPILDETSQPINIEKIRAMLLILAVGVMVGTVSLMVECFGHRRAVVRTVFQWNIHR